MKPPGAWLTASRTAEGAGKLHVAAQPDSSVPAPHTPQDCVHVFVALVHREHPRGVLLSRVHLLFSAKFQVVLDSVNVPQTHAFKHSKRNRE